MNTAKLSKTIENYYKQLRRNVCMYAGMDKDGEAYELDTKNNNNNNKDTYFFMPTMKLTTTHSIYGRRFVEGSSQKKKRKKIGMK